MYIFNPRNTPNLRLFVDISSRLKYTLVLIGILVINLSLFGQNYEKVSFRDGISLTPMAGITKFYGDAAPKDNQSSTFGLIIDKEFLSLFGVRLSLEKGNLKGTYEENGNRIHQGKTDYNQYGLSAYLNLSTAFFKYNKHRRFFVSAYGGGGFLTYNETNRYLEGVEYLVYEDGTTGADHGQIPFTENIHSIDAHGFGNTVFFNGGLMFDYKLSTHWYIKLDFNYNFLLSSRLDGYEHHYFDRHANIYYDPNHNGPDKFKSDGMGPVYTSNDGFATFKVGIKYRMQYKKRNTNTGVSRPSNRHRWHKMPANQYFDNVTVPGTNAPKVVH